MALGENTLVEARLPNNILELPYWETYFSMCPFGTTVHLGILRWNKYFIEWWQRKIPSGEWSVEYLVALEGGKFWNISTCPSLPKLNDEFLISKGMINILFVTKSHQPGTLWRIIAVGEPCSYNRHYNSLWNAMANVPFFTTGCIKFAVTLIIVFKQTRNCWTFRLCGHTAVLLQICGHFKALCIWIQSSSVECF